MRVQASPTGEVKRGKREGIGTDAIEEEEGSSRREGGDWEMGLERL